MTARREHLLTKISLKLLLVNRQGKYLILKSNPATTKFAGKYDLPGGRIDQGEGIKNLQPLIEREIKEELGKIVYRFDRTPVAIGLYHFKKASNRLTDSHTLYVLFRAKYLSGKITLSDEHTSYRWLKLTPHSIRSLMHPALHDAMLNYLKR